MSKNNTITEERIKRFKEMGLPIPMNPITTPQVSVKNLDFAAKLEAIKSGKAKEEVKNFIQKEGTGKGFAPLEAPKVGRNPNEKPAVSVPLVENQAVAGKHKFNSKGTN